MQTSPSVLLLNGFPVIFTHVVVARAYTCELLCSPRHSSVTSMLLQFFRVSARKQETSRSSPCSHEIFSLPEGPCDSRQRSCDVLEERWQRSPRSVRTAHRQEESIASLCSRIATARRREHQKSLYVSEACNTSRVFSRWLGHIGLHSVVGYVRTGTT